MKTVAHVLCGFLPLMYPIFEQAPPVWHQTEIHLHSLLSLGLEITAGQRTMSGLIGELTGQPFFLPVMLPGHIRSY